VPWPIRLELRPSANGIAALLDLPQRGMFGEPVPAAAGPSPTVDLPFGLGAVELHADGDVMRASIRQGSMTIALGRAPERPWLAEDLTFAGAAGTLSGTIYRPGAPGPHAGVVVLHGSAAAGRSSWNYRSWGPIFASLGLVALVYDKRGTDMDLADLAADARSAHAALVAQPDVRPAAVGLAGGSQAGWLGARVAASEAPVA
jgi:cephalosporin-C deacetylase-like acetyl esterase